MKIRMLALGLLAVLALAGCAHQPLSRGGTAEDMLGGTMQAQSCNPHATPGMAPYQQILADPGPF